MRLPGLVRGWQVFTEGTGSRLRLPGKPHSFWMLSLIIQNGCG